MDAEIILGIRFFGEFLTCRTSTGSRRGSSETKLQMQRCPGPISKQQIGLSSTQFNKTNQTKKSIKQTQMIKGDGPEPCVPEDVP